MTREERKEAIRCLSVHSSTNGSGLCTDEQHYKAKQMAIKVLEQEPTEEVLDKIRAEIRSNSFYETTTLIRVIREADALQIIDKYR